MVSAQPISDPADPRLAPYRDVRDAALRDRDGTFLVEGRWNVETLLRGGRFAPRSLFVTPPALESLRPALEGARTDADVYVAPVAVMSEVVGFPIHRGCIAVADRGEPLGPADVVRSGRGRPLVCLEGVNNHDNIGGVFRNARAFGAAGVLLGPGCVDPLYRKAVRVSMGGALVTPFAEVAPGDWPGPAIGALRAAGYRAVALTPAGESDIASTGAGAGPAAIVLGAEGPGLSPAALGACDERARIAMAPGVDSINVATACALALHRLAPPTGDAPGATLAP